MDQLVPAVQIGLGWELSQNSLPFNGVQLHSLQVLGIGVFADDFDVVESELLGVVTMFFHFLSL